MTRILVVSYFLLFIISTGIAGLMGSMLFRGIVLVPATMYVLVELVARGLRQLRGQDTSRRWDRLLWITVLYVSIYSVLYFPRAFAGAMALGGLPSLIVHVLFWHAAFTARVYEARRRLFFSDLWLGIFLAFGFGLGNALVVTGWNLAPGAVHNLDQVALFVRSDLDIPLLAAGLCVWGAVFGPLRGRLLSWTKHRWNDEKDYPGRAVAWCGLVAGAAALFIYSRRTPIFAVIVAVAVLLLPRRIRGRAFWGAAAFPLIPLAWDAVVAVLIPLTQNPIADAILARNHPNTYLTATYRLTTWLKSFAWIANVQISHLWGYGGAPEAVLPAGRGWLHTHNALIQLFFEGGLISVALAVWLVVGALRRLDHLIAMSWNPGDLLVLLGFLWLWAVLAAVEPSFRSYTLVHVMFLLICVVVANLHSEWRAFQGSLGASISRARTGDEQPVVS